jgi:hypothetical protein
MAIIKDGNSGKTAEVNDENELVTRAITESELEHASGRLGTAFSWTSNNGDIDVGDTLLFIKNTGTVPLILDRLDINPANVLATYSIRLGKATTTPAGNVITAVNLSQSGETSTALAYDDETAVADGSVILNVTAPTAVDTSRTLDGYILKQGHYIQINQDVECTSGRVTVIGHFENPS